MTPRGAGMPDRACAPHAATLLDLLDDPLGRSLDIAARNHLDTCSSCRLEAADALLTDVALRRSFAVARDARPPDDAWPRLEARLRRQGARPRPGRASSPIAGLFLAAGFAIAMLVPLSRPIVASPALHEAGIDPAAIRAAGYRETEAELRQLRATILAGKEASSDDDMSRARADLIRREAALVAGWRAPSRSPLSASAL